MEEAVLAKFKEIIEGEIGQDAAKTLGDSVEIKVVIYKIHAKNHVKEFRFIRKRGMNILLDEPAKKPDLTIKITYDACSDLINIPNQNVAKIGIALYKLLSSQDENKKVDVRIHTGLFNFFRKGYPGILTRGGSELAVFLAKEGLSSPLAIKNAISNLMQKE